MKKALAIAAAILVLPAAAALADASDTRELEPFDQIMLDGMLDATITVGGEQSVTVTVNKERYLRDVVTRVRDGKLTVETDFDHGFFSLFRDVSVEVAITVPSLTSLELDGKGDVAARGVDADEFKLVMDGMGTIRIDGRCGAARIVLDGMGDLEARNFECREVRLLLDGMGDAEIFASDFADVTLDGFGDVDVYGHPERTRYNEDGLGDIHDR